MLKNAQETAESTHSGIAVAGFCWRLATHSWEVAALSSPDCRKIAFALINQNDHVADTIENRTNRGARQPCSSSEFL
jgi:hypothetical protein